MKKKLPVLFMLLTALTILIQAAGLEAFAATGEKYIATGNVNLRSGPSTTYSKIDYILKNKEVEFISQYNSTWNKVKYNGKTGYASSKYLKPVSTATTSTQQYITTAGVNFRTGASTSYASLGIVSKGSTVQLISISNNWANVIYNGRTGYMHAAYISPKTESTTPPDSTSTQEYVTTAGVNFRTGPSTSYASLGIVSKGSTVQLISISNKWANVIYNGKTGYMHASYVSPKTISVTPPSTEPSTTPQKETLYFITSNLNARTGPSIGYTKILTIPAGTHLDIIGESGNWYKVNYKGRVCYVNGNYVKKSTGYKSRGIILANKGYALSSSFNPGINPEASEALNQLKSAGIKQGLNITTISGFRSYQTQKSVYNGYVNKNGREKVDTYSARPGHSEHQTGLAFDLGENNRVDFSSSFGETKAGKFIANNAHKYGFIVRYPKGKDHITGYKYEPWHVRYVGKDIAKQVFDGGLTLDEYLGGVKADY